VRSTRLNSRRPMNHSPPRRDVLMGHRRRILADLA
jgi:hypothetical protein